MSCEPTSDLNFLAVHTACSFRSSSLSPYLEVGSFISRAFALSIRTDAANCDTAWVFPRNR
jgi:hypothetical protein